ncbi:MAG: polysaccharide deacetylase family protein [Gammaproteobacteria bacterium]
MIERKGKKIRLIELVDRLHATPALRALHDRGRDALTILAYHRVTPIAGPGRPLDLDLVSATPESFDWQMAYLREHRHPVSLARALESLRGGEPLPPNAVAVTFDDGFEDVYRHALPILRRYDIPATVFAITGNIESGEPFWFERAAFLMASLAPGSVRIDEIDEALPADGSIAGRVRALGKLHRTLKAVPNERRRQILDGLARGTATPRDSSRLEIGWPLSWEQVRAMADQGIEFGSHTVTHPNLVKLSEQDLLWELTESRRVLQERLQREIISFAYPFGTSQAYDLNVAAAVQRAGFSLATSYLPGANWIGAFDRFALRRIGVGLDTSRPQFRVRLALSDWLG